MNEAMSSLKASVFFSVAAPRLSPECCGAFITLQRLVPAVAAAAVIFCIVVFPIPLAG